MVGTRLWSDALTINPVHKVRQTEAFNSLLLPFQKA